MNKIAVAQEFVKAVNPALKSSYISPNAFTDCAKESELCAHSSGSPPTEDIYSKMKGYELEEVFSPPKATSNLSKPHSNHVTFQRTYKVVYLGYAVLDRRYTLPMLPWVIAEIKRYGAQKAEEIYLEVAHSSLKAANISTNKLVFEHNLQTISKFAQTAQDPTCFTYMTREVPNGPCAYHVFQAVDECTVLELFTTLREMTKEMVQQQSVLSPLVSKSGSGIALDSIMSSGQHYEVLYLGRIKVMSKRAPPTFIDDAVDKFLLLGMEKHRNQQGCASRQRHGSGASVSSLPYNLDLIEQPKENELGLQVRSASQGSRQKLGSDSGENSVENLNSNSLEVINRGMHKSCSDPFRISPVRSSSFSENFIVGVSPSLSTSSFSHIEETRTTPQSPARYCLMPPSLITHTQSLDTATGANIAQQLQEMQPETMLGTPKQSSLPAYRTRVGSGGSADIHRPRAFTSPSTSQQRNRTMLFLIGHSEICLIGMDKKQVLFSKTFNDIAHCSQGLKNLDHFGFVCRETSATGADFYAGYIFRCQTERVVDEIMQSLKMAFKKAHQDYQHQPQPKSTNVPRVIICEGCPMQWFHRLCSDLEGLPPEKQHCTILLKLQTLPDSDYEDIMQKSDNADVNCLQERNEVLMMLLREFCEQKQMKHVHLNNSNTGKNDMMFLKEKGGSKLDTFRQKAKKSITSSFESFRKFKQRDDGRERSLTSISDNTIGALAMLRGEDIEGSSSYREGSYDGPSTTQPPGSSSPLRPRSSTFSTTHEVRKASKKKKTIDSRTVPPQSKSPIMNIFMKVGHQNQTPPVSGDEGDHCNEKSSGSWRQAIFHRVQTPVQTPSKSGSGDCRVKDDLINLNSSSDEEGKTVSTKKTKEQLRALWKKAILEQILLIRMEKENKKLQVSQDAVSHKRMKLDYEDITPCLKESAIQWDEMLNNPERSDTKIDKEKLMEMIKAGVPKNRRGEIWQLLAEQHNLRGVQPFKTSEEFHMPYDELLRQLTSHQHSILIDLGRTFPNHPFYAQPLGPGQLSLFNLLKAYSLLDSEVGYCQGLSFVAGVLLLHMPEESAFQMMKHILFHLGFRRQYKPDMVALQIQMYQLSRLMHDNYREVYDHLERYDIAPTLYAAPWFLTLFASQFPLGFVARLFDVILLQGQEIIFKAALVLIGNHRESILQCHGFENIMEFLKTTLPAMNVIEMQRVFNQVFTLDISKQLHAYEVEYHVLKEEMLYSPSRSDTELVQKLEAANRNLKLQNMELMEQLQVAYSSIHQLEASESSYKSTVQRLQSRLASLEEEKEVLLHSLGLMKKRLQKLEASCLGTEERPPSFQTVYALAGSERDEDEQLKRLIRDFVQERDKATDLGGEENGWVVVGSGRREDALPPCAFSKSASEQCLAAQLDRSCT